MADKECYIDVDFQQKYCEGERTGGDVFLSRKLKSQRRVISVLSDGLGSGVKANVLATLTSTMGLNYVANFKDMSKAARVIMDTLPVCSERRISYSTFTMVDVDFENETRIVEFDNPPCLLIRQNECHELEKETMDISKESDDHKILNMSRFNAQLGDRLIFYSDGVSQSGIGSKPMPFGWGNPDISKFVLREIRREPEISARELAGKIVDQAYVNNGYKALDDITCGVIYFRRPRRLLIMTGPPYDMNKDKMLAELVACYPGKKIICGGTTANIISRETGREVTVHLDNIDPELPPTSSMEGVDLITEGILTIGRVAKLLEDKVSIDNLPGNAAGKIVKFLLNSDIIEFIAGTRVNEFHQDPNLPVELEIRRNVVKKLAALLEQHYLKETRIKYI